MISPKTFCKYLVLALTLGLSPFVLADDQAANDSDNLTVSSSCTSAVLKVQDMYLNAAHTCREAYHKAHHECHTHTIAATTPTDLASLCDTPYNTAHNTCKSAYLEVQAQIHNAVGDE